MITADYQSLEPGNKVRLIEVDGSTFGVDDVLRFHAYNLPHTEEEIAAAGGDESKLKAKSIWWQGEEYAAWPYQIEGLEPDLLRLPAGHRHADKRHHGDRQRTHISHHNQRSGHSER